jgi:hypothetical protein
MGAVEHHTQCMRMLDVTSRFRHALNYCDDGAPLVPRDPTTTSSSSSASTSHSYRCRRPLHGHCAQSLSQLRPCMCRGHLVSTT